MPQSSNFSRPTKVGKMSTCQPRESVSAREPHSYTANQDSMGSSPLQMSSTHVLTPTQSSSLREKTNAAGDSSPSPSRSDATSALTIRPTCKTYETTEEMTLRHVKEEVTVFKAHRQRIVESENSWDDQRIQIYERLLRSVRHNERLHAELEEPLDSGRIQSTDPYITYRQHRDAAWNAHTEAMRCLKTDMGEERLRLRFRHEQERQELEALTDGAKAKTEEQAGSAALDKMHRWRTRWQGLTGALAGKVKLLSRNG